MLDSKILDFARQLIQADIKKRQRSFFDELSRKKRELHLSGNSPGTSSSGKKIIRNIFTKELESRAHFAWRSLQRAHKAVGSQPTETLAYDFKEAVAHFLDEIKKELSEFMMKQPGFTKDDTSNSTLDSAKNDACEKIDIEIDLYVSNLQSHITQKMNSGEKEYDRIVELLRKDYLLKTEDDVKQKVATAAQNMVDRGLSNSTVSINAQLKPRFEQIKNLFDYLIDSLQSKFADIPLGKFQNKLLVIAQEEYKRLSSVPTALLVQAGLTSQDLIKQYEQKIKQEMSKTKTRIETQCAISESKIHGEKRNEGNAIRAHKPWYKQAWAIIIGIFIILAGIWTLIQIYESETFKNLFGYSQGDVYVETSESHLYRELSPKIKVELISLLQKLRQQYNHIHIKISVTSDKGSRVRHRVAEEIAGILASAGFEAKAVLPITRFSNDISDVVIKGNESDIELLTQLSKILRRVIKTNTSFSGMKNENFQRGELQIIIAGDPLFSSDGIVTFQ